MAKDASALPRETGMHGMHGMTRMHGMLDMYCLDIFAPLGKAQRGYLVLSP